MSRILLFNLKSANVCLDAQIQKLCGSEMAQDFKIENAWILIEGDTIIDIGSGTPHKIDYNASFNMEGFTAFPSFCDSHTHIVYAGSREAEFVDKIKGLSYEDIALNGGGILNSAKKLQNTSEDELFEQSMARANEVIKFGTGAIEIKSGYGLTVQDELKMLRVAKRIKEASPLTIKTTLLAAHALPTEFKSNRSDFIKMVTEEMIPACAAEQLADFIDVFCDNGFFTVDETNEILSVAARFGLQPKIHANELDYSGGIQVGVKNKALSVDHLEYTGDAEIEALLASETMPTLLPSTAFFLRLKQPPAREMIAAGLPIALASDYNPGSSPSGNMQFVLSLACINLRMLPLEALHAATINSAYAMNIEHKQGSITVGKKANFFFVKNINDVAFLPYRFSANLVNRVMLNGQWIAE
jgi:imidazolonepropionase